MVGNRKIKSNDLGALLEGNLRNALINRNSVFWRLHTIRSCKGVSNPCDFIVLDREFTALIECKATSDDRFSCAYFRQLSHFEKSAKLDHKGFYGVLVLFYSNGGLKYVYAGDRKVILNKLNRRPIRVSVPESYDIISDSLDDLLSMMKSL